MSAHGVDAEHARGVTCPCCSHEFVVDIREPRCVCGECGETLMLPAHPAMRGRTDQ